MADNEGARETGEAIVMCTSPDVCRTNGQPVPYQIIARFDSVEDQVTNVRMTGMCTMTMASRITTVVGDEAGSGGGLGSGVNLGYCKPITHSTTVRANDDFIIYHSSTYWMNCAGPDGPGNTKGKTVYVKTIDCVYLGPLGQINGETKPPITPETSQEKSWLDESWDYVKGKALEVETQYKVVERGMGAVQIVGGLEEAAAGVLALEIPPLGAAIIAHGTDNTWAGMRQVWSGNWEQTYTQQAVASAAKGLGTSPETADQIGTGVDMVAGLLDPINDIRQGVIAGLEQAEKKALKEAEKKATEQLEKKALEDAEAKLAKQAEKEALEAAEKKEAEVVTRDGVEISKKELNELKPNSTYKVDGYTYKTDELGRVKSVEGELRLDKAERNKYRQRIAGGDDRLATDHGGHLVGSEFGGPGSGINLVPQDATLNQGEWKEMEKEWSNALKENKKVVVEVRPSYPEGSVRPESFDVTYSIDGDKTTTSFLNGEK